MLLKGGPGCNLAYCRSTIFAENRYLLFGIMLKIFADYVAFWRRRRYPAPVTIR